MSAVIRLAIKQNFNFVGSTEMYSMNETLARDRMRERERRSHDARLARELAAHRRWHRVSVHARAAAERHDQRARRVARAGAR
jgi:hypothetical protein